MNILPWLKDRFEKAAEHTLYVPIPTDHVSLPAGAQPDSTPLKRGYDYYRIWLVEMFLKNDREWFSKWQPSVHSVAGFLLDGKPKELAQVAGQSLLKDISATIQRSAAMNYPLTPLLPFNDGELVLEAGLLAIKGDNDVMTLLKVLGNFSKALVVPQLSSALAIAGPIAQGLNDLIGGTTNEIQLHLHQTLSDAASSANVLRAGYIASVAATDKDLDPKKFWVKSDQLSYGDSLASAQRLSGYHYMLFRVERRTEHDSIRSLRQIWDPYDAAIKALRENHLEEAESFIRAAVAAAVNAPELTVEVDQIRVATQVKTLYRERKGLIDTNGAIPSTTEDLPEDFMNDAPTTEEIANDGAKAMRTRLLKEPL